MRSLIVVCIFLFGTFVFAKEGFFSLSHKDTPKFLVEAQESVFMIVPYESYEFSPKLTPEKVSFYLENFCEKPTHIVHQLNCDFLKNCVGDKCNYYPHKSKGTAFLTGNGNTLITSFHVLYGLHRVALLFLGGHLATLEENQAFQIFTSMRPEFKLLNAKGEVVFDTNENNELPRYLNLGHPARFSLSFESKDNTTYLAKDYVEILLPHSLGKGLQLATNDFASEMKKTNQNVYALGFPSEAKRSHDDISSSGHGMYYTQGHMTDFKTTVHKLSESYSDSIRFLQNQDESVMTASLDASSGSSGGPIFNSEGEVIGILSGTHRGNSDTYQGVSFAVHIEQMKKTDLRGYYR